MRASNVQVTAALLLLMGASLSCAASGNVTAPPDDEGTGGGSGGTPAGKGGASGKGGSPGRGGAGAPAEGGAVGSGGSGSGEGGSSPGAGGASAMGGSFGPGAGGAPAEMPDIHEVPPMPTRMPGYDVIHSTNVSMWEIHDAAVYMKYKDNFDEIIGILERGYFAIARRLGTMVPLPLRVIIDKDGCCGGWAGGGDVGYADGDFMDEGGMNWVRGVVVGEVVNNVTGAVSSDWPRDWWADTAWYFPGFVTVDVLKEVLPEHAMKWEVDEKYPTYPVYVLYKALLGEQGWPLYQKLFASVKADKIDWSQIGMNPSPLKTNYVIAYISLAAGKNLGDRFAMAKVAGVDTTVVQAIMDAHDKLAAGGSAQAWSKFRAGDYKGAVGP